MCTEAAREAVGMPRAGEGDKQGPESSRWVAARPRLPSSVSQNGIRHLLGKQIFSLSALLVKTPAC